MNITNNTLARFNVHNNVVTRTHGHQINDSLIIRATIGEETKNIIQNIKTKPDLTIFLEDYLKHVWMN